jgi:hypothetical protein
MMGPEGMAMELIIWYMEERKIGRELSKLNAGRILSYIWFS